VLTQSDRFWLTLLSLPSPGLTIAHPSSPKLTQAQGGDAHPLDRDRHIGTISIPPLNNRKNRGFLHGGEQGRMQTRLQVFLAENFEPGQSDQSDQLINRF
jgi:hypothetical protein